MRFNEEFYAPALADIRERRRDFIRLMRRPDAEPLYSLLVYLASEGVHWQSISGLQVDEVTPVDSWVSFVQERAGTSTRMVVNVVPLPWHIDNLHTIWLHEDADPACKCEWCVQDRQEVSA